MIRRAQKRDLPALRKLWKDTFGDNDALIDLFFHSLFSDIDVYFAEKDGDAVSMLCALRTELVDACGETFPTAYLYAVCTHWAWRGQGLSRAVLAFAEAQLRAQGYAFVSLVPAEPSLFAFYGRQGYHPAFYQRSYTVAASQSAFGSIAEIDAARYRSLREMALQSDYISYDTALLSYQQRIGKTFGAGLYSIAGGSLICCAAAMVKGDILYIRELLPDEPQAAAQLAQLLGCKEAQVRTLGNAQLFGMIKPLGEFPAPTQAYLGQAFD
ncbi:MAG: GNAT family N-acetyltransferase [Oscillospiraceae bacterium]|jgi:GNAT superfamily N-acetyltransferase|nr:GNAT family N-acetyltransferase [Oscillospiraceae bacterium]